MRKNLYRLFKHRKQQDSSAIRCTVEALETRRLLTAWSAQDQVIGLDKETANYPTINGSGETVALIDFGVDYNHYALGNGYGNKIIYAWNYTNNTWNVMPNSSNDNAHGTGSAGEVAADPHVVNGALYQGVAPDVKLIALEAQGTTQVKEAMDWVIANRSKYNIVGVNYVDPTGTVNEATILSDCQSLQNSGVFVAGPAGNYGPTTAYAVYDNEYYEVGSSTLYGTISSFTPRGSAISFVAPADNIDVTWYNNGVAMDYPSSGTSWAAPQVVGAAALIKQVDSKFTVAQIASIIHDSATWIYDGYSKMSYAQLNVNGAVTLAFQRAGYTYKGGGYQGGSGGSGSPAPSPTPFLGTPFAVGSPIKAVAYDDGGEGVAYHDTDAADIGDNSKYRTGGVDIGWTNTEGGTAYVGWTHAGEWMDYTVNVSSAGTYNILSRVAAAMSGGAFHIEIDGKNVTGSLSVPNTGSWTTYTTLTSSGINLTAGTHILRVVMDANDAAGFTANFNYFEITPSNSGSSGGGGTYTPVTNTVPNGAFGLYFSSISPSALTLNFDDNANNESQYVIERSTSSGGTYSVVGTVNVNQATSQGTGYRQWSDSGLAANTTYYYKVYEVNQHGYSAAVAGSVKTT
jgi:hypothetical protein